jgi:hypothetical protein
MHENDRCRGERQLRPYNIAVFEMGLLYTYSHSLMSRECHGKVITQGREEAIFAYSRFSVQAANRILTQA